MASVSLSITVDQTENQNDYEIVVGSAVPGAGDLELRVNTAKFTSLRQIRNALEKLEFFCDNSELGVKNFKVL